MLRNVSARPLVRSIKSASEFDRLIAKHAKETGLPVIADFYSDGCGPCRQMAPIFKRLAKELADKAVFIKIDTNRIHEVSSRYSVRSIPTFIAFVNGKKTEEFSGAGEGQLRQMSDRAVDRSKYENVLLELESLVEYYQQKDADKTKESVEGVLKKCADMTTKGNPDKVCVGGAAQKLAKNLKKKYKDAPKLTPRFSPEQQTGSDGSSDGSSTSSDNSNNKKSNGKADKANLHLATVDDLRDELDRRLEAEQDAKDEEDDDEEEDAHGWTKSDFPERVVVVGGGPAGMSAAIYAARAGLNPVVIAPPMGGQLQGKGVDVENYPGAGGQITGPAIVATMRDQAAGFGATFLADTVIGVEESKTKGRPLRVITNTTDGIVTIETHAVIVATGAESNWLGIKGEYEMRGGGVSTCATCDGHFYKDTNVVVVGGGDTAMEDALVLARTSKHVTVVHRKDTFRASKVLAERVINHPSISVVWNTTVQEILGETVVASSSANGDDEEEETTHDLDDADATKKVVTGVILEDKSGDTIKLPCHAVFVAIGHTPTTKFLEGVVAFNEDHANYVKIYGSSTKTSVEGIFAAGDVADPVYRQAVTSAGSGAAAALDAERWLSESNLGNEAADFEAELLRELMEDLPSSTGSSGYNAHDDVNVNTKGYKESMGADL